MTHNEQQSSQQSETDRHNAQVEAAELQRWAAAPATAVAYFRFPLAGACFGQRTPFDLPCGRLTEDRADVTTWLGTRIGDVLSARVYRHNFGGRFVALRVRGTNGAEYVGRASYDNGNAIVLHKVQGGTR